MDFLAQPRDERLDLFRVDRRLLIVSVSVMLSPFPKVPDGKTNTVNSRVRLRGRGHRE
jgi:hypothetical protein